MEDVIFKYPLQMNFDTVISLPPHAPPVHVAAQDGVPMLWIRHAAPAESGPKWANPQWERTFRVVDTGEFFPAQAVHIGTLISGSQVWHVIEPRGT